MFDEPFYRGTGTTTRQLEHANKLAESSSIVWFVVHSHSFANMVRRWDSVKLKDNVRVITVKEPQLSEDDFRFRVRGSDGPVIIDHFVFEGGFL